MLLLVGFGTFFRYHYARQTTLAGYATAKAVAEQVSLNRRIYAEEILPRALRAGMHVETDVRVHTDALPVPVALVNMTGEEISRQIPGTRIRLFSRYPFKFRGPKADVDGFESEALDAIEKDAANAFYRMETKDGKEVMRYAVAEVMRRECANCHNSHPDSPRRDWKEGDVRGALEVTIPMTELSQRMRAEHVSFGLQLTLGGTLFALALGLYLRYDRTRWRREMAARLDAVTGLQTRQAASPEITREIARAKRYAYPISVVMLDVDHFKKVNDEHGHATGDRVLAVVGRVLREQLRQSDIAARWGGEEFLAVLPAIGVEGARVVAERIRMKLGLEGTDGLPVTISAGVAELGPTESENEVIARADANLYAAKDSGRNAVRG